MARYGSNRTAPVALILIIVAVSIAAFVSLARAVFFSGATDTVAQSDSSQSDLLSTSAGRSVAMTVRGPIVADEDFKSYKIVASANNRSLTLYGGYLKNEISQTSLTNNIPAYEQFVYALNRANLVKGGELSGDANDMRGICATGKLYVFEVIKDGKATKTLWTSSCKGSAGSLTASVSQVSSLFLDQISGSRKITSNIGL